MLKASLRQKKKQKVKKKPGTILPETFVSWCVSRDESRHTFCKLFSLIHQMGPHHLHLNGQIPKKRIHAYYSGKTVSATAKV